MPTSYNSARAPLSRVTLAQVLHLMGYGQSNSVGYLNEPSVTLAQPYANIRFAGSVRTSRIEGAGVNYGATEPLVESDHATGNYGETGVAAAANIFVEKMAGYAAYPSQGFVLHGSTAGNPGQQIENIGKGSVYYADWQAMIAAARANAQAAGRSYAYLATDWTQGEQDQLQGDNRAEHKLKLMTLAADLRDDARAATGQAWAPIMVASQIANHMTYRQDGGPLTRPEITLAIRDAGLDDPDLFVTTPLYWADYVDGRHLDNHSQQMRGKYQGRAAAAIMLARLRGQPDPVVSVDLVSALWQDKLCLLRFQVPVAPLAFDTSWISAAPNKGFDLWSADGATRLDNITAVDLIGPDGVLVTFSSTPPTGARLTYGFGRDEVTAGRVAGPRGQLRDSAGLADSYVDATGATRRLHNYCLIFETIKPDPAVAGGEVVRRR
ncbi:MULTISPECIES: hypothetical protein [unclassified Sphingobium]|uniref:hypothetical protein n=1 Tax=unclassified Sphingobium TaxID=2611147 RepID=UPI0035A6470F